MAERNAHREGKLVSKNLQSFMPRYQWARRFISGLEEKERTRRMNDPAECWAIINALNLSFIIRELGLGFCIFFYFVCLFVFLILTDFRLPYRL